MTLTLATVPATAEEKKAARATARKFFKAVVHAKKSSPATRKITKLRWHKSLKAATKAAAKAGKPVLWIQALGELRGYT